MIYFKKNIQIFIIHQIFFLQNQYFKIYKIICTFLKQCFTNVVFLYSYSSSFNLDISISFKSHLCSDKQILKHLFYQYTLEQSAFKKSP